MRARYPDREGVKSNASVPIAWEEYGTGASTVLFMPPVTRVLEARGKAVPPASHLLAGESAHFESEAREHDLHAFHA